MRVNVGKDLTVGIGDERERVSPGEAFRLAETLIRAATVAMIAEETTRATGSSSARRDTVVQS